MRFIAPTRYESITSYKNRIFDQQFRYRAGVLSLNAKWVVKIVPFFILEMILLSFASVNDLYMYDRDVKEDALPSAKWRQKLELVISA